MIAHIRACLLLLVLTVVLCCGVYPLALWVVGRTIFPDAAAGSLVLDRSGNVVGSRLIAQPFADARYFQPRPSAVSYNAAGSGGSNWAASQPLLRDRVARLLGPMVRYAEGTRKGQRVGPDIEAWFRGNPGLLGSWAGDNPAQAARWVKDGANEKAAARWLHDHPDAIKAWREKNSDARVPEKVADWPDDFAVAILHSFAAAHPRAWPVPAERKVGEATEHSFRPAEVDPTANEEIQDLQPVLFDAWLQAHPDVARQLKKVPADMVLASGSGLDPHITLRNALYQLDDHVAEARAKEVGRCQDHVRGEIEAILQRQAFSPLGGLVGEPLVNVLEVNLALDNELTK